MMGYIVLVSLLLTSHSKILCICVCIHTHLHTCIHVGRRRRGEERRGRTHSIPGLGHYYLLPPLLQIIPAGLPSSSLSHLRPNFNPAARVILIKHVSPGHASLRSEPSSDFHLSQSKKPSSYHGLQTQAAQRLSPSSSLCSSHPGLLALPYTSYPAPQGLCTSSSLSCKALATDFCTVLSLTSFKSLLKCFLSLRDHPI